MGTCNQLIKWHLQRFECYAQALYSSGMYYKCLVRSHIRFLCETKCVEDNRKRLKRKQIEKFLHNSNFARSVRFSIPYSFHIHTWQPYMISRFLFSLFFFSFCLAAQWIQQKKCDFNAKNLCQWFTQICTVVYRQILEHLLRFFSTASSISARWSQQ